MRHWLKEARLSKGLKMKEIAKELDVSESYYSSIEAGKRQVKMDMAIASRLSRVLDIPLDVIAVEEDKLSNNNIA